MQPLIVLKLKHKIPSLVRCFPLEKYDAKGRRSLLGEWRVRLVASSVYFPLFGGTKSDANEKRKIHLNIPGSSVKRIVFFFEGKINEVGYTLTSFLQLLLDLNIFSKRSN